MTKIRIILGLILLVVLQSCLGLKKTNSKEKAFYTDVLIIQNDDVTRVSNNEEVLAISKEEFSLRFYQKAYDSENKNFYSVQLSAFLEKQSLDALKVGMRKSETKCFHGGSGLAASFDAQYENMTFTNSGSHYMFYENEEHKRLKLVNDSSGFLLLEFSVDTFYIRETKKEFAVKNADFNEFYVAILIDRNLNGIIDKGELKKLEIQFRD